MLIQHITGIVATAGNSDNVNSHNNRFDSFEEQRDSVSVIRTNRTRLTAALVKWLAK